MTEKPRAKIPSAELVDILRARLKYMKDALANERMEKRELRLKYEALLDITKEMRHIVTKETRNEDEPIEGGSNG